MRRRRPLAGPYLAVHVGDETLGIASRRVRAVYLNVRPTHIPSMPPWIEGVIHPGGRLVPVINLRTKYAIPGETPPSSVIVVANAFVPDNPCLPIGLLVDRCGEVQNLTESEISSCDTSGCTRRAFCQYPCQGRAQRHVSVLLDLEHLIAPAIMQEHRRRTQDQRLGRIPSVTTDDRR